MHAYRDVKLGFVIYNCPKNIWTFFDKLNAFWATVDYNISESFNSFTLINYALVKRGVNAIYLVN